MSMTITLSDFMARQLTEYLGAFRQANEQRDNAYERGDVLAALDAKDDVDKAARRLACVLDCVIEGGAHQ